MINLCSVVGSYVGVLPHMLRHYRELGVDRIMLATQCDRDNPSIVDEIRKIAREFDAVITIDYRGPWHEDVNARLLTEIRRSSPRDWFILSDQDELQSYPTGIQDVVSFAEARHADYIEGALLDRVSESGELISVSPTQPIGSQFPWVGFFAYAAFGSFPKKVVAAKGYVDVTHGQHSALNGFRLNHEVAFIQIHHFKWVEGLVGRLATRASHYRSGDWKLVHPDSVLESEKAVQLLSEPGVRLDRSNPGYLFARASLQFDDYPHWNAVIDRIKGKNGIARSKPGTVR